MRFLFRCRQQRLLFLSTVVVVVVSLSVVSLPRRVLTFRSQQSVFDPDRPNRNRFYTFLLIGLATASGSCGGSETKKEKVDFSKAILSRKNKMVPLVFDRFRDEQVQYQGTRGLVR